MGNARVNRLLSQTEEPKAMTATAVSIIDRHHHHIVRITEIKRRLLDDDGVYLIERTITAQVAGRRKMKRDRSAAEPYYLR